MTLVTMLKRSSLLLAFACAVMFAVHGSAAVGDPDRPGRAPGLPFVECVGFPEQPCADETTTNEYGWINAAMRGLTGSVRAKQWAQIPLTMTATAGEFGFTVYEGPWDRNQTIDLRLNSFLTSPTGSTHNYGDSPLIPVRTVAFGSIPAEVTLQVGQERDSAGNPVPFTYINRARVLQRPYDRPHLDGVWTLEEAPQPLEATVEVRVVRLQLDGVDVQLGAGCTTGVAANLSLTNEPVVIEVPRGQAGPDPLIERTNSDLHFYGASGGTLRGVIDIPDFHGCVTASGDDISPILTSAISGPDNPVATKVGTVDCINADSNGLLLPNQPGVTSPYNPRSGCNVGASRGSYAVVPSPLPFPDYAPGAPAP